MSKNASSQKPSSRGGSIKRDAFVLGRAAFAKVSAVEGIEVGKTLDNDLRRLADATSAERRRVLAGKYGKP